MVLEEFVSLAVEAVRQIQKMTAMRQILKSKGHTD
jgi:hypothetical protein